MSIKFTVNGGKQVTLKANDTLGDLFDNSGEKGKFAEFDFFVNGQQVQGASKAKIGILFQGQTDVQIQIFKKGQSPGVQTNFGQIPSGLQTQPLQASLGQQAQTPQQPQAPFEQQPQAPFGQQPQAPFGQQPQAPFGQQPQAPFGQQPQTPFGQQPQAPFGQQPQAPFGQQPQAPFGQQPQTPFGQQPQAPFGQQPQAPIQQQPQAPIQQPNTQGIFIQGQIKPSGFIVQNQQTVRKQFDLASNRAQSEIKMIEDQFEVMISEDGKKVELNDQKNDFKAIFLEENAKPEKTQDIKQQLLPNLYLNDASHAVKLVVGRNGEYTKVIFKKDFNGIAIQWATGVYTLFDYTISV